MSKNFGISDYIKYFQVARNLEKNKWLPVAKLQELQERNLKIIIRHAYQNVPFYNRLFSVAGIKPEDIKSLDDLYKIPLITKSDVREAGNSILATNIHPDSCRNYHTSGSTGKPLGLLCTKEDVIYTLAYTDRIYRDLGINLWRDKLVAVVTPDLMVRPNIVQRLGLHKKIWCNVFDPVDVQLEFLKKIKPDILTGFPSTLKTLAEAIKERNVQGISPRLISTRAEVLTPDTRKFISSVFKTEIFDIWATQDTSHLGWECREHKGYHLNLDTVIIEIIGQNGKPALPGEIGEVVVTNLHSFAMPIIRYRLEDLAIPTHEECTCGRAGYLLKEIIGRQDDFIKLADGKPVSPRIFTTVLGYVSDSLKEFQIRQESDGEVTAYIVLKDKVSGNEITRKINRELEKALGNTLEMKVSCVESINREKSGKLRAVVSRMR